MGILLGLIAGFAYGAADFIGGLASRRTSVFPIVGLSQLVGLISLACLLPLIPAAHPKASDLLLGLSAGVAGSLGIVMLYRGLAIGRMSVVSPITAVLAASAPVTYGILFGERPTILQLVGVALALVAVILVSLRPSGDQRNADGDHESGRLPAPSQSNDRAGVLEACLSGVGIGAFYILLSRTSHDAGLWPIVSSRTASTTMIALAALFTGRSLRPTQASLFPIAATGLLDVAANACYLLATRRALLALAAVLASLYPASTVLLARIILKERFAFVQIVGMMCAGAGIVLMTAG